jgi:hypothetical protein
MDNVLTYSRAVLSTTALRWQRLTGTLPVDLLERAPAAGEWSAADCLRHLLDTERFVFPVRVRGFLSGAPLAGFNPDEQENAYAEQTPAQLADQFARLREENLALLAQVTPEDLTRASVHSELGPVTLGEMVHEWAAHDLDHTIQAERSVMQPFITGCGPWRSYFIANDVEAGVGAR